MEEIVSVHIGESGAKLGEAIWEKRCLDYQIGLDGSPLSKELPSDIKTYFYESSGKYKPRALFIDSTQTSSDELKVSKLRNLFSDNSFAFSYVSESNFKSIMQNTEFKENYTKNLRAVFEQCSNPKVMQIFSYVGSSVGVAVSDELVFNNVMNKDSIAYLTVPNKEFPSRVFDNYSVIMSGS